MREAPVPGAHGRSAASHGDSGRDPRTLLAGLAVSGGATPLSHRIDLGVLGIPIRVSSDVPAVVETAGDVFGGAGRTDPAADRREARPAAPPVEIRVVVHPGPDPGAHPPEVRHHILSEHRILLEAEGSVAVADPGRRRVDARVTEAFLAYRDHFRQAMLESVILAVVTRLDRQPLHGAAVARDGDALLLCGPGGTGKSTLVWAAGRSGLTVLAEDTVYLETGPRVRVWGMPGALHLPPEQGGRFPELEGLEAVRLPTGKTKLRIAGGIPAGDGWPRAERAGVCLLRRVGRKPGVAYVAPDELTRALTRGLEPGFDLFRETLPGAVGPLAAGGGWRLDLPPDPREAVPWVAALLEEVRARGR